jgi:hypothetical protein
VSRPYLTIAERVELRDQILAAVAHFDLDRLWDATMVGSHNNGDFHQILVEARQLADRVADWQAERIAVNAERAARIAAQRASWPAEQAAELDFNTGLPIGRVGAR